MPEIQLYRQGSQGRQMSVSKEDLAMRMAGSYKQVDDRSRDIFNIDDVKKQIKVVHTDKETHKDSC